MRTNVNACNCTRGCTDTVGESALKVDSGRKIPFRTGESNLRQRRAGPGPYQLNNTLTPFAGYYLPMSLALGFGPSKYRVTRRGN